MTAPRQRLAVLLAALGGLFLWAVYQQSLCPAFPPNDSPETITAAYTLGIQHPPGYPLDSLLGRVAMLAWPVGSPAWRMNCLSALMAVLTCLLLARWTRRAAGLLKAGFPFWTLQGATLAGALWLGLSRIFWQQATEAKGGVYLLNALLLVLMMDACLDLLTATGGRQASRALRFGGLWLGLALANHYPSVLVELPFVLVPPLLAFRKRLLKPAAAAWAVLLLAAGLSVYLELPLRAAFHPLVNLGNPVNWGSFWFVVLRKGYSQNAWAHAPGLVQAQFGEWWLFLHQEGGWLWPLAALAGGAWLWRRKADPTVAPGLARSLLVFLAGLYLAIFVAVIFYNRNEPDTIWLLEVFLLAGQVPLAALACLGLAWVAGGLRARLRGASPLLWLGLPLLAAGMVRFHWTYEDRRGDFFYWDFANNILASLPQDTVYIPEGDFYFMPLYYSQGVEHRRPDVAVLHRNVLATWAGLADLKREKPSLVLDLKPGHTVLQCLVRANRDAVHFATGTFHTQLDQQDLDGGRLAQRGLAQVILPPAAPDPPADLGLLTTPRFDSIPVSRRDLFVHNMLRWYPESWAAQLRGLALARSEDLSEKRARAAGRDAGLMARYQALLGYLVFKMNQ